MNKLKGYLRHKKVFGHSLVDWVNLRRIFDRREVGFFSAAFPIIGQYILLSGHPIIPNPNLATYLLYFGLLLFSFAGLTFLAVCPFCYRRFDNLDSFIKGYADGSESRNRLRYYLGEDFDFDSIGWDAALSEMWVSRGEMGAVLRRTFKAVILLSVLLIVLSSMLSIANVFILFWSTFFN